MEDNIYVGYYTLQDGTKIPFNSILGFTQAYGLLSESTSNVTQIVRFTHYFKRRVVYWYEEEEHQVRKECFSEDDQKSFFFGAGDDGLV